MKIEGWPMCARCGRAVEEMTTEAHPFARNGLIISLRCHGASEKVEIANYELIEIETVTLTTAFVQAHKYRVTSKPND